MRLLLSVVSVVVLVGVNYIANINQELIVRSRLESSRSEGQFSDSFIRRVASIDSMKRRTPESALVIPKSIIGKKYNADSLIQKDGTRFNLNLRVSLKQVSDRLVELSEDKNLTFYLEAVNKETTILSLVSVTTGEKVTLKAIQDIVSKKEVEKVINQSISLKSSAAQKRIKGLRTTSGEFDLYQAIIPKFSKSPLRGDLVSGRISVIDGSVEEFDVSLINVKGEEKNLSFNYSEIRDGGIFSYDDDGVEAFGILTNDGENGVRVRFSTGSMAGATVSFSNNIVEGKRSLPKDRIINLKEKARADFKERALSNRLVKESSVKF